MGNIVFESWQLDLLDQLPIARLATIATNGQPRLVPACFARVDDAIAIAIDEKPKRQHTRLARLADIDRDPRVTLLADRYDSDWSRLAWVRIEGIANVYESGRRWPAALDALRERYVQYRAMQLELLPLIRITPTRVTGWRWSDTPG